MVGQSLLTLKHCSMYIVVSIERKFHFIFDIHLPYKYFYKNLSMVGDQCSTDMKSLELAQVEIRLPMMLLADET